MKIFIIIIMLLTNSLFIFAQEEMDLRYMHDSGELELLSYERLKRMMVKLRYKKTWCESSGKDCREIFKADLLNTLRKINKISKRNATKIMKKEKRIDRVAMQVYKSPFANPDDSSYEEVREQVEIILEKATTDEFYTDIENALLKKYDEDTYKHSFLSNLMYYNLGVASPLIFEEGVKFMKPLSWGLGISSNVAMVLAATVGWAVNPVIGAVATATLALEVSSVVLYFVIGSAY